MSITLLYFCCCSFCVHFVLFYVVTLAQRLVSLDTQIQTIRCTFMMKSLLLRYDLVSIFIPSGLIVTCLFIYIYRIVVGLPRCFGLRSVSGI